MINGLRTIADAPCQRESTMLWERTILERTISEYLTFQRKNLKESGPQRKWRDKNTEAKRKKHNKESLGKQIIPELVEKDPD